MLLRIFVLLAGIVHGTFAVAGFYEPAAGVPGSTAVPKDADLVSGWAPGTYLNAPIAGWASGYQNYVVGSNVDLTWQTPAKALGKAVGDSFDIVGLGNGGQITLTFGGRIVNGAGADFAVFENSFSDNFLELAWVEVSSNGTDFLRFPNFSSTLLPVGSFESVDPTNIDGLAGKYRQGFGTPFDLDVFSGISEPWFDVNNVRYVRIVDIVGDGNALDSLNSPIYDPYPNTGSAGFDLDAIGVIHLAPVPEPETYLLMVLGLMLVAFGTKRREIVARLNRRFIRGRSLRTLSLGSLMGLGVCSNAGAVVTTFDDLTLAPNSFYSSTTTTSFSSGAATFQHYGNVGYWEGWTYSNTTNTTTPGFANQYSAYTGGGFNSANYGVTYAFNPSVTTINFAGPVLVSEGYFTNTTYAALSMLNGDGFAKKFGGASGNDPDFFKLRIIGLDAANTQTGFVDFYLADFRSASSSGDYIINQWTPVNLASLGAVSKLSFVLSSSDSGQFGMNTPAYFALDNLNVTAVPEPETYALMIFGLGVVAAMARRRRR